MGPVLVRLALITIGLAMAESALGPIFAGGSLADWALLAVAITVLVAGTAGFMEPLLAGGRSDRRSLE